MALRLVHYTLGPPTVAAENGLFTTVAGESGVAKAMSRQDLNSNPAERKIGAEDTIGGLA